MHARVRRFGQFIASILVILGLLMPASAALGSAAANSQPATLEPSARMISYAFSFSTPVIDGGLDEMYQLIADDNQGDHSPGVMDLEQLFATQDRENFYFAFSVNGNVLIDPSGAYVIYIDLTNGEGGATFDPWGHKVQALGPHAPEFAIRITPPLGQGQPFDNRLTEIMAWEEHNSTWVSHGPVNEAALLTYGQSSMFELRIKKTLLGSPEQFWMEVWSAFNEPGTNAQDTINDPAEDWNAAAGDITSTASLWVSTFFGSPRVDGIVDGSYGPPLATDPFNDHESTNLDLGSLYVTEDELHFYFAFTVNEDIATNDPAFNWGKYVLYLNTDYEYYFDRSGATYDAWGRNVQIQDQENYINRPEYAIYSWVDVLPYGPANTELWAWKNDRWNLVGTVTDAAMRASDNQITTIEWKVNKFSIGNPKWMTMEVWDTGPVSDSNAQDTINSPSDDWNAPPGDWTSTAYLQNSTSYYTYHRPAPLAAQDSRVEMEHLYFNSRDPGTRLPVGPVKAGTPVTLRIRSAENDLSGANVVIFNDRTNQTRDVPMRRVQRLAGYDTWEALVPIDLLKQPTVLWYRFMVWDNGDPQLPAAYAYYEDDAQQTGGLGQAYSISPGYPYQLTVYDPNFVTPDWAKEAIIYQVFLDRFRDGNPDNNPPKGSFYYDDGFGTITRSLGQEWNAPVCDPRLQGKCFGVYGQNFYGGDLAGLIEQLPYLQDLGINTIYLNAMFDSPSNHREDTRNYMNIAPSLGTPDDFKELVLKANTYGIRLLLDGVFNFTSSDSVYFDRYRRYEEYDGACESLVSKYRDWYRFKDAGLIPNGPCAGNTIYQVWEGNDQLAVLDSTSASLQDYLWASGPESVAGYWLTQGAWGWRLDQGGHIDPGPINDPTNGYWEGFRKTAKTVTKGDAYIVGEERGNASAWLLGNEWDAAMNYQLASALLGFWRDWTFVDNDFNERSTLGPLNPVLPSEFNDRLNNLMERYPPQALYAMMNLITSQDTSRALLMLDHGPGTKNPSLYFEPTYNWSDAMRRLKGVVMLQMSLPGAPAIYYGDEVGLVAPGVMDHTELVQDDPYNRQPFPWLDESGIPFYTHLQTMAGQAELRDFYKAMIQARKEHPALATGSFDTLYVDNTNGVYAFGRRIPGKDAVVVVINRNPETKYVTIPVGGYLSIGSVFLDPVSNISYTVYGYGNEAVAAGRGLSMAGYNSAIGMDGMPGRSGVLLVYESGNLDPLPAPTNLMAQPGNRQVTLTWNAVPSAAYYKIYRADFGGETKEFPITTTSETTFTDLGLVNGEDYYYTVQAVAADALDGFLSSEVSAVPSLTIDWAGGLDPDSLEYTLGSGPTGEIRAQVYIQTETNVLGATETLIAQLGMGPASEPANPSAWTQWSAATFKDDIGENDRFAGTLLPAAVGSYQYAMRFSTNNGLSWTYTDAGALTVSPSSDTTPPTAPGGLFAGEVGANFVVLGWEPSQDDVGIAAYEVYRSLTQGGPYQPVGQVPVPAPSRWWLKSAALTFRDEGLTSGQTYYYVVKAIDTSLNYSDPSNELAVTPQPREVAVTIRVSVPDFTPGAVYFSRDYNPITKELGDFATPGTAMTQVGSSPVWSLTLTLMEGALAEFKFHRGTWETVQTQANGNDEVENLSFTTTYGVTGEQTLEYSVANWRDPIVVAHSPAKDATEVDPESALTITWNQAIKPPYQVSLSGPGGAVSGTVSYDPGTYRVTFTPNQPLAPLASYTVTVSGQQDEASDVQQVPVTWSFRTSGHQMYLPLLMR